MSKLKNNGYSVREGFWLERTLYREAQFAIQAYVKDYAAYQDFMKVANLHGIPEKFVRQMYWTYLKDKRVDLKIVRVEQVEK